MFAIASYRRSTLIVSLGCFASLVLSVAQLSADVIHPSLPVGSQYQLAFVTSGGILSSSTNIADYNTFVTQEAALSSSLPSATWYVIGSTQTDNARDNASTYASIPIYNTHGQLVASGSAALWSGTLQNSINYDQYGGTNPYSSFPHTGTNADGTIRPTYFLGSTDAVGRGHITETGTGWITGYTSAGGTRGSFYALSSPITIVPEPSVLALLATGMSTLLFMPWRQRRRAN